MSLDSLKSCAWNDWVPSKGTKRKNSFESDVPLWRHRGRREAADLAGNQGRFLRKGPAPNPELDVRAAFSSMHGNSRADIKHDNFRAQHYFFRKTNGFLLLPLVLRTLNACAQLVAYAATSSSVPWCRPVIREAPHDRT